MSHPHDAIHPITTPCGQQWGLTKREYIAALCMAGALNNGSLFYADKAVAADTAVGYADALLASLGRMS